MSYVIKAVLSNPRRPECGQTTIPFPIPVDQYDQTIDMLQAMELGGPVNRDCRVDVVDSHYSVLGALEGKLVNVDELDYLAKRLDGFCAGEVSQFQAMAHKLEMTDILIDSDAQGNLTAALGYTPIEQSRTLANLLLAAIDYPEDLDFHLQKAIIHTDTGIDLIPANRRLADAAARLQVMQLSQYNAVGDAERASEKIMAELLEYLRPSYDYIIIDCGLKHELLTVNALAASDYCIIPVQAHFLASEGIPEVLELVKSVREKFNPNLQIAGILLTMYQSRPQLCRSVRESVDEIYGEAFHVFERPIEYSIKVAECPAAGQSIFDYAPKNAAAES